MPFSGPSDADLAHMHDGTTDHWMTAGEDPSMSRFRTLIAIATTLMVGLNVGGCATRPLDDFVLDIPDALTPGIFNDLGGKVVLPAGMTLRPVVPKGIAVTKAGEGWRPKRYNDAARYCTIGYGHLIKRAPCDGTEPAEWLDGITEPEGEALLVKDMAQAQTVVMLAVTTTLTDTQYAALCDFVFNVGGGAFRKSTLLKVVNAGQHDKVASQLLRYVWAGGKEVPGLVNRRNREIELYYDGTLTPRAVPVPGEDMSPIDILSGS